MNLTGFKVFAFAICVLVCFIGCKPNKNKVNEDPAEESVLLDSLPDLDTNRVVVDKFQLIIENYNLEGSILFFNTEDGKWLSNDFDWAEKRRLPASTFKIVNTIIGLETKTITDSGIQFKWNRSEERRKMWRKDFELHGAFHASCLPCYQELARNMGLETMNRYLDKLDYGKMVVDSSSLDNFWIKGESGVSQIEQIDFLKRLYNYQLPVSAETIDKMKSLMVIESNDNYKLSGKTGWGFVDEIDNGWFVGYIENAGNVYFFATNVSPGKRFKMELFPRVRSEVTLLAFKVLQSYQYE